MQVRVVGWHIHPDAARCNCGKPATVVVTGVDDNQVDSMCNDCLSQLEVVEDAIAEAFNRALGDSSSGRG